MRKSKILVVEDEREIGLLLKKYLKNEGYEVICAEDGQKGLNCFLEDVFDLVITDIMMPVMDGIALCKEVRKQSNVPIIFLTAKDDEVDKLIGLMQGADDYITKPFSIKEVVARVKAILRRYLELSKGIIPTATLDQKGVFIDFNHGIVKKNDEVVSLRLKEYEILKLLAKQPEKVFSKSQIFESVWGSEYLGDDNTVMVHIRRIRNKLEDDPNEPKFIKTVWGLGYKFTLKDDSDE